MLMEAPTPCTAPVTRAIDNHLYKGQTGWNHALNRLNLRMPRSTLSAASAAETSRRRRLCLDPYRYRTPADGRAVLRDRRDHRYGIAGLSRAHLDRGAAPGRLRHPRHRRAVYPTDRIVILKRAPVRFAAQLNVAPRRPRDWHSSAFRATKSKVLKEMRYHGIGTG